MQKENPIIECDKCKSLTHKFLHDKNKKQERETCPSCLASLKKDNIK